jgi:thiamine kinase-like enzyme
MAKYQDPKLMEEQLQLNQVSEFISSLGFKISELTQKWRHATGVILDEQGQKFFFKLASTPEIGNYTANEMLWDKFISNNLPIISNGMIFTPKIHLSGSWQGKTYYIGNFVEGELFPAIHSDQKNNDIQLLESLLPDLAKIAVYLTKIDSDQFWCGTPESSRTETAKNRFFKFWHQQKSEATSQNINSNIIVNAESLMQNFTPKIAHGDFSIGNLIICAQGQYAIIDTEQAYSGWPMYYDIANMLHRLGTRESVNLADRFLKLVINELSDNTQMDFMQRLLPVVSYCAVRGYYELQIDQQNQIAYQRHFKFAEWLNILINDSNFNLNLNAP